jgi:hypothetical protein
MPSSYSQDLRIELIAPGEQSGVWGTTTNTNLGTIIEDAIAGTATVTTATQKYALLAANGSADQARCAILVLDTTYVGAGNYEVYAPPVTKLYVVKNASTTKALDLYCATAPNGTTASGAVYTIPIGKTAFVRAGQNPLSGVYEFYDATDYIAGSVTFTNANLITPSLSGETFSTAATITAGTDSQGQGPLTSDYNIITTAATSPVSGVTLPTATVGRRIIIVNRGANPVNVYPFGGGTQQIDSAGANNPIPLPVNGSLEFNAATVNRWYSNTTLSLNDAVTTAVRVATTSGISAAGTAQGDATALTADYNIISTAPAGTGVRLPTATIGRKVLVVNRGANAVNVYPASGAVIDSLGANTAISLPVNGLLEFNAAFISPTPQWYSSYNATTASSVGGVSFTGTQPTASVNQVAVYGATGSSITTGRTYQFRATSAGAAQLQLFEDTDNGTNSIIIQPPATLAADYTLTLPTALPATNGEVLSSTTGGVLSWTAAAGGGVTSLTGTLPISVSASTGAVTVSVANASSSAAGVVSTGTQQFAGAKRFATGLSINAASVSNWGAYILSDTSDPGLAVFNRGVTSTGGYAGLFAYDPTRGANPIVFQFGSSVGGLATTGSISGNSSNVAYNTSSDYRLKENIVPLTDAITKLKLLAPKRFTWKAAPEEGVVEGFIAHEVQEIVPVAVHGEKDAVDANGKIVPQGIDSSFLIPLLTAALQEAVARIEALEARLNNQ